MYMNDFFAFLDKREDTLHMFRFQPIILSLSIDLKIINNLYPKNSCWAKCARVRTLLLSLSISKIQVIVFEKL